MRKVIIAIAYLLMFVSVAWAQQPPFHDELLDHLVGKWVLQGTIAGAQTTHDIDARWVLGHQFLLVHEISRDKKESDPAYEAMVFIGWDEKTKQYVIAWIDDYGGLEGSSVGHGKRNGDEIAFLFNYADGPFHNVFAYDPQSDTWQWRMDNEDQGKLKPFARVKLTRVPK